MVHWKDAGDRTMYARTVFNSKTREADPASMDLMLLL